MKQFRNNAVPTEFYILSMHQRIMIYFGSAQAVPAVNQNHLPCNTAEQHGIRGS